MADTTDNFMDYWIYNIERPLRNRLEPIWPDPDDPLGEPTFIPEAEARQIRVWLNDPIAPKSRIERQRALERNLLELGICDDQAKSLAREKSRHTGRSTGRPKVNGQYAIRALYLYLTTSNSWRGIVEVLKGPCEHGCELCGDVTRRQPTPRTGQRRSRPTCTRCRSILRADGQKQRVCISCADALRDAVGLLEMFLRRIKLHPGVPRRVELNKMTTEELEKHWPRSASEDS